MQSSVLILFCHPAFQKSRINRRLVAAVKDLPGVRFHDLYEAYPDFDIDVPREQELVESHDTIVFQHPFFWYSCPALLKEWHDLVLEYGWAYGPGGQALEGKRLMSAITTGGGERAYTRQGYNFFTIRELLAPFEQTARLCGISYLPPFVVHGAIQLEDSTEIDGYADSYRRVIETLRDGDLNFGNKTSLVSVNESMQKGS